jgi:transposase
MKERKEPAIQLTYSEAFRLKVVNEIESGKLTIAEASRLYEINGNPTIYNWIRKYGKNELIRKSVRIEMKGEKEINKALKEKIRELEQALAAATVENICGRIHIEELESHLTEEEKKTLRSRLSPEQRRILERTKSGIR